MALWCIFFIRVCMFDFGMFSLATFLMECSCMAPLTPPLLMMLISGSYLVCYSCEGVVGESIMTNVNSMS